MGKLAKSRDSDKQVTARSTASLREANSDPARVEQGENRAGRHATSRRPSGLGEQSHSQNKKRPTHVGGASYTGTKGFCGASSARAGRNVQESLGFLETTGMTPALVALDAMEKAAAIRVLQVEWNDSPGVIIKILGNTASVRAAVEAGHAVALAMGGRPVVDVIARPDPRAWTAIESPPEYNPLMQSNVVVTPSPPPQRSSSGKESRMADSPSYALGFIETQGFTAVFEAIDSACKAANVEVVCKEKLGGGYVTVVIKGDVAAVNAAVEAGKAKVEGLGKLIAAHVIARPSSAVLTLLPK